MEDLLVGVILLIAGMWIIFVTKNDQSYFSYLTFLGAIFCISSGLIIISMRIMISMY